MAERRIVAENSYAESLKRQPDEDIYDWNDRLVRMGYQAIGNITGMGGEGAAPVDPSRVPPGFDYEGATALYQEEIDRQEEEKKLTAEALLAQARSNVSLGGTLIPLAAGVAIGTAPWWGPALGQRAATFAGGRAMNIIDQYLLGREGGPGGGDVIQGVPATQRMTVGQGMPYVEPGEDLLTWLPGDIGSGLEGLVRENLGGVLAGLGIAGVGAVAGGLTAAGMQWPWETPEGEGFIAPWTEQVVLPSGLVGQAGVQYPGEMGLGGSQVVKSWTNASRDGRIPASVQFFMMANGRIYSRSLVDGQIKSWRPKKHIVISRDPRLSTLKKLQRVHTKVSKMVRHFIPKKATYGQVPASMLSAAEKKLLKRG